MHRIIDVSLDNITPSKSNPRKSFKGIDELAASVKVHGVISPLLVRPALDIKLGTPYELVAGERRWRAAKKAGVRHVPAIVRELSDKEVLEIQVVENVQRADVHPLEEADGYEVLLEKHGYDVDGIAGKIGKSKAYVYARLKLAALAPYPRKAFLEDRLSASVALLIARIPDVGLQEKATREILAEPEALGAEDLDAVDMDDPASSERRGISVDDDAQDKLGRYRRESLPMSVREAQIHLRRRYMLRLELATFAVADPQLVPKAGPCTTCSYRTGNQRELFSEVSSADVCTNPPCFEEKTKAAFEEKALAAKAQGMKVVEKAKTERMFSPVDGRTVSGNSPYVDPKAQVPYDLVPLGEKRPTWEKLLGKKVDAPKVLVQDQTGAPRELLDKNAAVKALREAGKVPEARKATSSASESNWKKKEEAEKKRREIRERAHEKLMKDMFVEISKAPEGKKELAHWRWIVRAKLEVDRHIPEPIAEVFGKKGKGKLKDDDLIAMVDSVGKARQMLFCLLVAEMADRCWSAPEKDGALLAGIKLLGLDYDKAIDEAKTSADAADKAEQKVDEKKKPAKKGGKKS